MSQILEKESRPLRVAIHQPNFLPRLKVLQKLAYADIWCVLDNVQFCKGEWQSRTRIVPPHGNNKSFWFSIPVHRPHGLKTLISEVVIAQPSLTELQVERTLLHSFRSTPYWGAIDNLLSSIKPLLATNNLTHLCVDTTYELLKIANRQPVVVLASSLPVTGRSSELIASLCRHLKASTYLADSGATNYLKPTDFTGIEILWQNWQEPIERWQGVNQWRNISSLNYLCRVGTKQFTNYLLSAEFTPKSLNPTNPEKTSISNGGK